MYYLSINDKMSRCKDQELNSIMNTKPIDKKVIDITTFIRKVTHLPCFINDIHAFKHSKK